MISIWRIDKASRSRQESFSGKGAAIEGGRWNLPGTMVVYAAQNLSLAALEKFIHVGDEGRDISWVFYEIQIPGNIKVDQLVRRRLPGDWKAYPASNSVQTMGTQWINRASSAVLKVPSVIIATEDNYLLNPHHADFNRLIISPGKPFQFDDRLWRAK